MEDSAIINNVFFAKRFGERFTQNYTDIYADVPGTTVIFEFGNLSDDQVLELFSSLKEIVCPAGTLCMLNIAFVLPTNELIEKWAPTLLPIVEAHKIDGHRLPLGTVIATFFRQAEETWSSPGYKLLRSGEDVISVRTDYQASQVVSRWSHLLRVSLYDHLVLRSSNPIYAASSKKSDVRLAQYREQRSR
jgi:hypothetical protein